MKKELLIIMASSLLFLGCGNKKQFEELTARIEEQSKVLQDLSESMEALTKTMESGIENQTSLLYRTIGDVLPVVVPEENLKQFENLKSKISVAYSDKENEQKFNDALEGYKNYIGKTAPWIQESQAEELMEAKYDLDFIKINVDYKKNPNDFDLILNDLANFVLLNSSYSKIASVVSKYDSVYQAKIKPINAKSKEILEKNKGKIQKSEGYDELIKNTNQQINVLYAENISDNLEALQNSLAVIMEKQNELKSKEYFEPINKKTSELLAKINSSINAKDFSSEKLNELEPEVENHIYLLASENLMADASKLRKQLDTLEKKLVDTQNQAIYKKYVEDFNSFVASAKKSEYNNEQYVSIQQVVPFVKLYKPGKHDEDDIILFEWKTFADLNINLSEAKSLIEPIQKDISKYDDFIINAAENNLSIISRNIALIGHTKLIDTRTLMRSVTNFQKDIERLTDKKIDSDNNQYLVNYRNDFTNFKTNVSNGNFSQNTYLDLQGRLNVIQQIMPAEYQNLNKNLEEVKLFADIKSSIATAKNQVSSLSTGQGATRGNNVKISVLNEQIASMQYNLSLITTMNVQKLKSELDSVVTSFNSKLAELERKSDDEQKQLLKKYNTNVLNKLKQVNSENNRINSKDTWKGVKKDEKLRNIKDTKIRLLKDLESIDTNYLYPSVYTMYNQVYASLWSTGEGGEALEVDEQFTILNWSLTNTKWGLYDNF